MECSFTRPGTHSPSRLGIWRRARLLPNENVDSSNANRYLEEIAHVLEFRFFDQQAIESLPGGALLGGACEDCNFKDDQSGFDRYRHSRLRLLHINGEGAIQ